MSVNLRPLASDFMFSLIILDLELEDFRSYISHGRSPVSEIKRLFWSVSVFNSLFSTSKHSERPLVCFKRCMKERHRARTRQLQCPFAHGGIRRQRQQDMRFTEASTALGGARMGADEMAYRYIHIERKAGEHHVIHAMPIRLMNSITRQLAAWW